MSKCYTVIRRLNPREGLPNGRREWVNTFNSYENAFRFLAEYDGDRGDGLEIQIDWVED